MGDLISKLGLDWKLLLAQIIDFLILLWILKKYAYKPILGMLEKRRKTIEKGMADAKTIEERLAALEQEKGKVLAGAQAQAHAIVETASKDAAAYSAKSRDEAKAETAAIIADAKKDVERMKDGIVADAKAEIADLVVSSTEKIIRVKLNATSEKELISDALRRAKE